MQDREHRCDDCHNFLARDGSVIEHPKKAAFANETMKEYDKRWVDFYRSGAVVNCRPACDPEHPFRKEEK